MGGSSLHVAPLLALLEMLGWVEQQQGLGVEISNFKPNPNETQDVAKASLARTSESSETKHYSELHDTSYIHQKMLLRKVNRQQVISYEDKGSH